MSLPSSKPAGQQSSIRSFFRPPKAPTYAPPPSSSSTVPPPPPAPRPSQQTSSALPIPPIAPPVTAATNPALPREATIRAIEDADVAALRRLNGLLLPVSFPDSFYAAALDPALSHRYSRVITWRGDGNGLPQEPKIVGAVVCIPEPAEGSDGGSNLYIRSLGILAPYRALGLANAALDDILASAHAAGVLSLRSVTAHVWTENDEGLAWYLRRGFERVGAPVDGYYRRLRPDSAILVSRPVRAAVMNAVHAHNGTASAVSGPSPKQIAPSVTAAIVNTTTSRPPPPTSATLNSDARPPPRGGGSYQNQRSDMEWNDLPVDMMSLPPPRRNLVVGGSEPGSGAASGASSRSSSSAAQKKKRDRSYPAAAFGG